MKRKTTEAKRLAYNARQRAQRLLRRTAFDGVDYDAMLMAQENKCLICGDPPTSGHNFHIDHDHKNGKIRGLLCGRCNMGLGLFRDNVDNLAAAMQYLNHHNE